MSTPAQVGAIRLLRRAAIAGFSQPPKAALCTTCRAAFRQTRERTSRIPTSAQSFSTAQASRKKSSGSSKPSRTSPAIKSSTSDHVPNNQATKARDSEIDPYDFGELQAGIDHATARLKDALTKTRDAGRVSAAMIETLPVEVAVRGSAPAGQAQKQRTRVGDLATVVPKGGRVMQVFCGEEAHIKPITSAIQASDHSLVPQPDAHNPLLLLIPVPPATAETRQQAAGEAKKCMDRASLDVRTARGDAQKRFRKMELGKLVIVDELRKAHKEMEEVVKKGQDEVKRIYEGALKTLER